MIEIQESYDPIDFHYLTFNLNNLRIPSINFSKFKTSLNIFKRIHNGDVSLEDIEKEQAELKRDLGRIN